MSDCVGLFSEVTLLGSGDDLEQKYFGILQFF